MARILIPPGSLCGCNIVHDMQERLVLERNVESLVLKEYQMFRQFAYSAAVMASVVLIQNASIAETRYVSVSGSDSAGGTIAAPWRTIQHAADLLKPGDKLLISAGTYREQIVLKRGGTALQPISISAVPGARVVVTGADMVAGGWEAANGLPAGIYRHVWDHRFPINGPNDLTHPGDLEHQLTGRAEQVIHAGRLLRQVLVQSQLAPGTFFSDLDAKLLYVWLRGSDDPNRTEIEASTRTNWLEAPSPVSFIEIKGIRFRYAANHAQRGAFVIGGGNRNNDDVSRGWLIENCIFERANGPGASFTGEMHTIRQCDFQDNGQLGFGTSRCDKTEMINCGIYRNNLKGYSTGWEAGGLKVTMSRGFTFDHCRSVDNRGTGIWFDIGNEKCEVKNCYIADNDEAGIFCEISYRLSAHDNVIVNNANNGESVGGAWGSAGITLSSSENCTIENNRLIGNRDGIDFREQERTTPRIDAAPGAPEVRIFNRGHIIRNNFIAYSQAFSIGLWMDTNFFGPHPSGGDTNRPIFEDPSKLGFRFEGNELAPLAGKPNYLYGVPWRPKSRTFTTPQEFTKGSGISDSSTVEIPPFKDVPSG